MEETPQETVRSILSHLILPDMEPEADVNGSLEELNAQNLLLQQQLADQQATLERDAAERAASERAAAERASLEAAEAEMRSPPPPPPPSGPAGLMAKAFGEFKSRSSENLAAESDSASPYSGGKSVAGEPPASSYQWKQGNLVPVMIGSGETVKLRKVSRPSLGVEDSSKLKFVSNGGGQGGAQGMENLFGVKLRKTTSNIPKDSGGGMNSAGSTVKEEEIKFTNVPDVSDVSPSNSKETEKIVKVPFTRPKSLVGKRNFICDLN